MINSFVYALHTLDPESGRDADAVMASVFTKWVVRLCEKSSMLIMNIRLPQLTKHKNIPANLTFFDKNIVFLSTREPGKLYRFILMNACRCLKLDTVTLTKINNSITGSI